MMTDSLHRKYDYIVAAAHELGRDTNTFRCDPWQLDYILGALARGAECAVMVGELNPANGTIAIDVVWHRGDDK